MKDIELLLTWQVETIAGIPVLMMLTYIMRALLSPFMPAYHKSKK